MNKKQRKDAVKVLLAKYKVGETLSPQDSCGLNKLLETSFERFYLAKNTRFPSAGAVLMNEHGSFSWNKCIDGYNTSKNLDSALRAAVKDQMDSYFASAQKVCAMCGRTQNLSVDHKVEPFSTIKRQWLAGRKNDVALEQNEDLIGWKIANAADLSDWRIHHAKSAIYQILCRSCNSSKGAKV